jgi:hypothetical protein
MRLIFTLAYSVSNPTGSDGGESVKPAGAVQIFGRQREAVWRFPNRGVYDEMPVRDPAG